MISLAKLKVREGELVSAEKYNAMLAAVEAALTLRDSPTARVSRVGRGVFVETTRRPTGGTHPFKPSSEPTAGGIAIRWSRGKVAGLEPEIAGVKITDGRKTPDKRPPALEVPRGKLKQGEAHVYFCVTASTSWAPLKVELQLHAEKPTPKPYQAFKLAATVQLSDPDDPASALTVLPWIQHNLGWWPSLRTASGQSRGWFWAT